MQHAAQPDPESEEEDLRPSGAPTLATKLHVPSVPRHLVLRERLFDALDRGVRERLQLLCAPAGAGKTMFSPPGSPPDGCRVRTAGSRSTTTTTTLLD